MPTVQQYQNLVIASLSAADPSAQIDLTQRVPLYWNLYTLKARWPDIRFWYVYRECVMLLMGRMRMQIDTVRRNSRATGDMQSDASSDGSTHANTHSLTTETGRSTSAHGIHKQLDSSMSSGNGAGGPSLGSFTSTRRIDTTQHHDDIGSGSGGESSWGKSYSSGVMNHFTTDANGNKAAITTLGGGRTAESLRDFSQTAMREYVTGQQVDLLVIGAQTDTTRSEMINNDVTRITSGDHSLTRLGGTRSTGGVYHESSSHNDTNSHFDANVQDGMTIRSDPNISRSDGSSLLVEHTGETGATHGTLAGGLSSQLTTRTNKSNSATGVTTTRDSSVGISHSEQASASHFQMQKLQQRFAHLDMLWKEASKRIAMLEQQATISERYQVNAMNTLTVNDYPTTAIATIANAPWLRGFESCATLITFPF